MHGQSGFADYAFASWHDVGSITITPIDVHDESSSVTILRSLLAQWFEREDLVNALHSPAAATHFTGEVKG